MLKKILSKSSYSSMAIIFIAIFIVTVSFSFGLWKQNRIIIDAPSYYAYLPSVFIYKDIHLNYVNDNPGFFKDFIWYDVLPDGNRIIRYSMGLSLALSPFFFMGHIAAWLTGAAQDGYSMPYQNAVSVGVIFYLLAGLYFLRKTLLKFFSEKAVALTLICTVIGTNLLWYSTFEGLMSHGLAFSFLCFAIYNFFQWMETKNKTNIFLFASSFGIILLIRLMSVTLLLYFLIACIMMSGGIKNFFTVLKQNKWNLFIGLLIIFILFVPQFIYWKLITGNWFYNSYKNVDHQFFFNNPQMASFLFSFRKGWLIYTPVMWLAIIGMIPLYFKIKPLLYATFFTLILTIYLFSAWWAWSYGICWGMRTMIDSYSFLSFPMAAFFSFVFSKNKIYSWFILTIISLLILLNLFQTWQYKKGLLHFDYMTREAYFKGFLQTQASLEWYDLLKPFDWDRHKKGLPQIEFSKKYFDAISKNDLVYLRGFNMLFISENENRKGLITCMNNDISKSALFHLIRFNGDTVALQSYNGKYFSVKNNLNGVIMADADAAGHYEKFILKLLDDDDNRISVQTLGGKDVFVNPQEPFILYSSSDPRTAAYKTFRLFVWEK
jgi:hypothetical protein